MAGREPGHRLLHLHRQRPRRRAAPRAAGLRPVVLELGSISPTIVCEDADLDRAAARCAASAFRRAGQVCTSTQRLFVQRGIERPFCRRLLRVAAAALQVGDPRDPAHRRRADDQRARSEPRRVVGAARRSPPARRWSPAAGATARCCIRPSWPTSHPRMRVVCEEIFAPVVSVIPVRRARRSDRAGQRDAVRARRRHLLARHHPRDDRGPAPPRRPRARQRRPRAAAST